MGLGLFKAFCCSKTHEIPIVSSDSSPQHTYKQPRKNQPIPTPPPPPPPRPKPSQSSQIGPVLGKPYVNINLMYEMKKELGRGQSGVTYLCVEKSTGREYACKSISRRKLLLKQEIDDVRREILILQHLSGQPNIVEFRGAYEDMQNVHLVMELCSGGELFDHITEKGNYSEREAAKIMRQIMNVVHVCHFMGVLHRDLKPENFLLASKDENAAVKATDFGLSVFIEEVKMHLEDGRWVFPSPTTSLVGTCSQPLASRWSPTRHSSTSTIMPPKAPSSLFVAAALRPSITMNPTKKNPIETGHILVPSSSETRLCSNVGGSGFDSTKCKATITHSVRGHGGAPIGFKKAVSKTIMQLISVGGLTRENVASHLQKYQLYLKRMQGFSNEGPSSSDQLFTSTYACASKLPRWKQLPPLPHMMTKCR